MFSRVTASGARLLTAPHYLTRRISFKFTIDTLGNTLLHQAIHDDKINTTDDFLAFAASHESVDEMLKWVNNGGFLPVQCINPWDNSAMLAVSRKMLACMKTDEASTLPLSEAAVLAEHDDATIPELNRHLKAGVALANAARQSIPVIPIHPKQFPIRSLNSEAEIKISKVRRFMSERIEHFMPNANIYDYPDLLFRIASLASKTGVGNCGELSMSVLYELAKLNEVEPQIHGEFVGIPNGDHTVVVLGRKSTSLKHQPFYWGEAAVIVDSTLPAVYPVFKLDEKLRGFSTIRIPLKENSVDYSRDQSFSKLTYYNSAFHRVDVLTKEPIVAGRLAKYSLFKQMQMRTQHEEDYIRFKYPK